MGGRKNEYLPDRLPARKNGQRFHSPGGFGEGHHAGREDLYRRFGYLYQPGRYADDPTGRHAEFQEWFGYGGIRFVIQRRILAIAHHDDRTRRYPERRSRP